jgi:predicted N-acetyltransferase YhbS
MRGGIGQQLLHHALHVARRDGAKSVTVDADPNAAPFYLGCGAALAGEVAAPIAGAPARTRPQFVFALDATATRH